MEEWRAYQERAAAFFRLMGLPASVDVTLHGARGVHMIDIVVRPPLLGLGQLWLVECKAWSRPVPKERVLTFQQIVADVGADRGIFLSERGFQRGAHRASVNTNVTLASLNDLFSLAEGEFLTSSATPPYVASFTAHEDSGQGPDTDLFLRRSDGGALTLPITCLLVHSDGRQWLYDLRDYDLPDDGRVARVCLYHFNTHSTDGEVPGGARFRVVWRTVDGPVTSFAAVDLEK